MGTTRTAWICQTELVGIQQKGVGVVDLQDFLFAVQSVLFVRQGIDKSIAQGVCEGSVFTLGSFDFVCVSIFVLLYFSLIFVLVKVLVFRFLTELYTSKLGDGVASHLPEVSPWTVLAENREAQSSPPNRRGTLEI